MSIVLNAPKSIALKIRNFWRGWRIRRLLVLNAREIIEINDKIRLAEQRHGEIRQLRRDRVELTNERLRLQRKIMRWEI